MFSQLKLMFSQKGSITHITKFLEQNEEPSFLHIKGTLLGDGFQRAWSIQIINKMIWFKARTHNRNTYMLDNKLPYGLTLEKFKSKNLHNTIKKYSHLAKNVEFYNSSWVSGVCLSC